MKITFLLTQDLSSPSGLGRYFPWAKELVKLGYDVHMIALHPDFAKLSARHFTLEGVSVDYVAQMHVKKSGGTKTYFSPGQLIGIAINGTAQLIYSMLKTPADVLVIGKPHPMNSIAAFVGKLFHPKTKVILDCDDLELGSNRFQTGWQKKIVGWFEKAVPRWARLVTSNTKYNLNHLQEQGISAEKLIYIPNGYDPIRFRTPDDAAVEKLRSDLGLSGNKVVAFIGSLSLTNHPVDLLMRAFPRIHSNLPDARLLIVGTGEDLPELKELARTLKIEQVTQFIGRVAPDQVPLYYAISDVTVDPVYDNEAARGRCPLKMFESWACGVPFVTSGVGDRLLLAGDPPAALIVSPGDEESLANGLLSILGDPLLQSRLKTAATNRVGDYSWPILATRTHHIFASDVN